MDSEVLKTLVYYPDNDPQGAYTLRGKEVLKIAEVEQFEEKEEV